MRKSRFTDEQIVAILRETDREPINVVAKRQGLSEQTIYTWRRRFGTFQADDVRRLKQLEAENARSSMSAHAVVVIHVRQQNVPQVSLPNHHDVVETFPADRADQPLRMPILPRRPRRDGLITDTQRSHATDKQPRRSRHLDHGSDGRVLAPSRRLP